MNEILVQLETARRERVLRGTVFETPSGDMPRVVIWGQRVFCCPNEGRQEINELGSDCRYVFVEVHPSALMKVGL